MTYCVCSKPISLAIPVIDQSVHVYQDGGYADLATWQLTHQE